MALWKHAGLFQKKYKTKDGNLVTPGSDKAEVCRTHKAFVQRDLQLLDLFIRVK